ncbi:CrcB protein [Actinobacillus pleuropneumoniae]|uniref:fluoride efflux transporter FluC n=1 Tax=Actinobacillus pleuropneumoniae TaxID=715 RepID=UPI0001E4A438|nr:CrcB family protein [Actinobacillus pleuropneumoniae]EFM89296.1 Protein crcB [Actinobacillus pleuropneumoniae serovar 4 str. M62]UKH41745.1 chromosome condensation protein CrcB [Actinobacillus pleuropneumoniae serovar 4 str. M62]SQF65324.1 CrcB protein [Actinobacillus pleuropneumoniae]
MTILWISFGAVLGAISRWQLGVWFNGFLSQFAFGTLLANLLGCFLIGIAIGLHLNDGQKLLFITSFLGSFTTFSSFSLEVSEKLLAEKYWQALSVIGLHLIGGILCTVMGILLVRLFTSGRIS